MVQLLLDGLAYAVPVRVFITEHTSAQIKEKGAASTMGVVRMEKRIDAKAT